MLAFASVPASEPVLDAIDRRFQATLADLVELSRIPSVSAAGFDPKQLERSADRVATLLADAGLESVEILRQGNAHPYVMGEWLGAGPDVPTAIIYAHHDVQPPGRLDHWESPAFEPTVRADGRLYGRGVVDDKAGLLLHLAALRAWKDATGAFPINVKVIVEGEEEISQIVDPATVLEELLDTVLTIQNYVVAAILIVGVSALATAALVFLLSLRLRRREIDTMVKIGGSRARIGMVLASEVLVVLILAVMLAGGLTVLTASFGSAIIRSLILS